MSQAEHPDRTRPDHEVTVEDVRQLMGASTPHFALQLRNRIAKLIAPLSGSGKFGPLLLVTEAQALPQPLQDYLLDVQPGYDKDPVRGVYNHGWVIGDDASISIDVQSRIDALLEIQPVQPGS